MTQCTIPSVLTPKDIIEELSGGTRRRKLIDFFFLFFIFFIFPLAIVLPQEARNVR